MSDFGPMIAMMLFTAALIVAVAVFVIRFFRIWLRAALSGVPVTLFWLVAMQLRKVNPRVVVDGYIMASKAGLGVTRNELATHFLAAKGLETGVEDVVRGLIAAKEANVQLTFSQASAIYLAGGEVTDATLRDGVEAGVFEYSSSEHAMNT